MIRVSVHLISAIDGSVTELARADICNEGGTNTLGDYSARSYRGRCKDDLDRRTVSHVGTVTGYPRLQLHVWNLVARALKSMGYK